MGLINTEHVYSYSQLQAFDECPYQFYLARIEKVEQKENAFAQQGTLIHDLIDQWGKGILTPEELPEEYMRRYPDEVTVAPPRMLAAKGYAEKTYNLGLDYFKNFDCFTGYKIINTEEKFETDICGRRFVGIIDMILEDELTGELIILDHKSKSLQAFKKEENTMYRQQFIYAKHFIEKYGRNPDTLMFNLFKENGMKMKRSFSLQQYYEVLNWAKDTIIKIEDSEILDYLAAKDQDFYCTEICSVRGSCHNGKYVKKNTGKKR